MAVELLGSTKQIFQYKVLRSIAGANWSKRKRRTVAWKNTTSCSWMKMGIVFIYNKKNNSNSIVRDIHLHNKLSIEDPVHKNEYESKCFLQKVKSIIVGVDELLRNVLLDKAD